MEKKTILSSFLWTALETYSIQVITFLVSVFMARILSPSDYGVLGIIGVFIALSDTFIDAGFTNALINKKNCTNKDYSTVFYFNIIISILFFCILFVAAPFIAEFYRNPVLIWTTRAMALSFVISSVGAVPMTIMTKELRFRPKAVISVIVSVCSGVIGIYLAYNGFGVWALVWQTIFSSLIRVIIYVIYVGWIPLLAFSKQSFKDLFGFGSKLLGSNIIFTLYNNIYALVIGKVFNPTQLGYFARADNYPKLILNNISGILSKILFPILSQVQDNDSELIDLHKKFIIVTSLFVFPACLFLMGLSSPLVYLILTEKWMPIVPLLRILCFSCIFDHFSSINGNFILSKGKSGLFLKMNIFTKPTGLIILTISIFLNLEMVAVGKVLYSIVCFLTGYFYLKKVLEVSFLSSMRELFKMFVVSLGIAICEIFVFRHIEYSWANLFCSIFFSCVGYMVLIYLLCPQTYALVKNLKKVI